MNYDGEGKLRQGKGEGENDCNGEGVHGFDRHSQCFYHSFEETRHGNEMGKTRSYSSLNKLYVFL